MINRAGARGLRYDRRLRLGRYRLGRLGFFVCVIGKGQAGGHGNLLYKMRIMGALGHSLARESTSSQKLENTLLFIAIKRIDSGQGLAMVPTLPAPSQGTGHF